MSIVAPIPYLPAFAFVPTLTRFPPAIVRRKVAGRAEEWEVERERGRGRKEGGKGDGGRRIKSGDEEDREWQTRVEVERDGQGDELKSPQGGNTVASLYQLSLL